MSTNSDSRSWLVRFCDTFLQEQNIKYMLGVGMLILLGSSLMLVTSHWDSYTPAWKYLILIAYTATIHVAGQVCYHSLGLRKTGTGLMSLTVLLLPLSFLAVRWIHPDELFTLAGLAGHAALAALLGVNVVFTALAARRIFHQFLRGTQPTFLISYFVLCVAGVVVPVLPTQFAPWTTLVLWCVFAIGSIKVNRHIFWLTEERRLPRIYGFFPIMLLGGMFLTLFGVNLAFHVPLTWIGCGCALVAIPVLLAADTVADVFQKRGYLSESRVDEALDRRTGLQPVLEGKLQPIPDTSQSRMDGLQTRPTTAERLPWSVALPLWIGLALTAAGVCLSAAGFPDAYGLTPTALLAAAMMTLVARRTGRVGFVWAMLLSILVAYQASPVFFRELARTVVHQGAMAVHEQRLPYAFYGLTYLPLLACGALAAVWRERRSDDLFAEPLRRFAVGLSLLLLGVSLTHVKAIFPAGAALTVAFLAQTLLFRDRRLLVPAVIAWTTATLGSVPFLTRVLELPVTPEGRLLIWTGSSALLFALGRWLDPLTQRFKTNSADWIGDTPVAQVAGFGLLLIPTVTWFLQFSLGVPAGWLSAAALSAMLLVHGVRWRAAGVVDLSLAFPVAAAALIVRSHGADFTHVAGLATVLLFLLWSCSRLLMSSRASQLRGAFAGGATRVSTAGLAMLLVGYLLPVCGMWILSARSSLPVRIPGELATWLPMGLIVLWAFDAARRQWAGWIVPGWVAGMALSGAVAVQYGASLPWLPALWAALTFLAVPKVGRRKRSDADVETGQVNRPFVRREQVSQLLSYSTFFTFSVIALLSLLVFNTAFRVAGAISLCGLLCLAAMLRQRVLRTLALMVVNWQVMCVVVQVVCPDVGGMLHLGWDRYIVCALPVALAAALQALTWQRSEPDDSGLLPELIDLHSVVLQLVAALSMLMTLTATDVGLAHIQIACAVLTFAALAALRVADALRAAASHDRLQHTAPAGSAEFQRLKEAAHLHTWCAIGIVTTGVVYLWLFGVFNMHGPACLFGLLAAGIVSWLIAVAMLRSPGTAILAKPLQTTALWLPGITVLVGVVRHCVFANPEWLGLNSLALLLAAGFYFWRGLEQHKKSFLVLSASIVNVALALLWRELKWSDPQFFMIPLGATLLVLVELLKPEIPKSAHDPLRYVGALTILVSPTFHIVGGSWLHLLSLMVASVVITLVAMGLRVRALMYMGTGFLVADIVAMVVRGSIDRPSVLWMAGILLGAAVIALAAWCERHREELLQRLRLLSAELQTWE